MSIFKHFSRVPFYDTIFYMFVFDCFLKVFHNTIMKLLLFKKKKLKL